MSVHRFLDTSVQEDAEDDDESVDENDRDNEVDHRPRVTQLGQSGRTTFNQRLNNLFHRYSREGSVAGSNSRACQSPVCNTNVGMDVDVGQIELRIFMIELPTAGAAAFVLKNLKGQSLHCRTFRSLPRRIFIEACSPLEVQQSLPLSHSTLVKDIMRIPREELISITQRCNIPVRSWVRILFGTLKGNIAYVLCVEDGSIGALVVPRSLPYQSDPQSPSNEQSIFDVDLARGHGLEVTVSTSDEGHPIAYCEGKEYYYGCSFSYFPTKWVKVVSVPLPDEIAWFSLASVDPLLVDRTLTRFSAQWWQDGDTGWICYGEFAGKLARIVVMDSQCESVTVCVSTERSSDEVVEALEISVHDFKLEFPTGTSIQVIAGLNCGFQGIVIGKLDVPAIFLASHVSPTTYISREPDNQVPDDPLIRESHIQPGDFIRVISGPHKGLCGMLHWHSGCEILITPSMLQQADPDNLGDKGKSRAQEPEVLGSDGDIDEGSDLIQVSVSMDEVLIIPPSTLQFSREKGYDVTIGDRVRVAHGPAVGIEGLVCSVDFVSGRLTVLADDGPLHNVLIGFCVKLENHSLRDVEHQVGHESTVDPSAESGPSTLACDPWVPHSDDTTPRPLNELAQAEADYGCVPWLFDNNFCDYANWRVCLRVAASYNRGSLLKRVVHTTVPDCFSTVVHGLGLAPPGHVSVTVTSSTVSANIEHHFIPACDLTPANPRSAGQYCLVLHGELAGQIHQVKKCQVKKDPKGVELEDGTKLPLGDVCQVIPAN
ncbi:hypothetical protein EDC04DRAFT_2916842 [Pisolithus marmoratus]|nr:hypothetical protein EDC04DRAFT_2916842 [Pisolithus marmoratus]